MASSSKSEEWKYFVRESAENKVKCSICDIEVDHKRGSTSAAKRHLIRKHNEEITTVKSDSVNVVNVASAIEPKQPKLHQFMASKQSLSSDSTKAKALTYHVANVIFCDLCDLHIHYS